MEKTSKKLRTTSLPSKRLPADDDEDDELIWFGRDDGAYEQSSELLSPMGRKPRPFPSSQVLAASTEAASKPPCPLIQDFLRSVGEKVVEEVEHLDDADDDKDTLSPPEIDATSIDSTHFSTMTEMKHKRYRQLSAIDPPIHSWREAKRKEYKKLSKLVSSEKQAYRQALLFFWEAQRQRLTIGFRGETDYASNFTQLTAYPDALKDSWRRTWKIRRYGKCCQNISLLPDEQHKSITLDSISSKTVDITDSYKGAVVAELPPAGAQLPKPSLRNIDQLHLLRDDERAVLLAKQHKAHIVTTVDTLQVLLHDPEYAQWMIPISRVSSDDDAPAILDLPFPHPFSSPRDCTTRGLEEGLYQWLENDNNLQGSSGSICYEYILLTLPPVKNKICRILVRKRNRLYGPSREQPLHLHASVEYFPERGTELSTCYDRVLWILDLVLQPRSRVVVGRIDPSTCSLLGWDEVGLAHALVGESEWAESSVPLELLGMLAHILYGVSTIGSGEHVMCLPTRGSVSLPDSSVSVHEADKDGDIDFGEELDRAGEVLMGSVAFRRSFRPWKWASEQVPYTFPVAGSG